MDIESLHSILQLLSRNLQFSSYDQKEMGALSREAFEGMEVIKAYQDRRKNEDKILKNYVEYFLFCQYEGNSMAWRPYNASVFKIATTY